MVATPRSVSSAVQQSTRTVSHAVKPVVTKEAPCPKWTNSCIKLTCEMR